MGRYENITVFKDTEKLCKTNPKLSESVKKATASQKLILGSDVLADQDKKLYDVPAKVVALANRNVIKDYLYAFKNIEYAVYCSPKDDSNFKAFERALKIYLS